MRQLIKKNNLMIISMMQKCIFCSSALAYKLKKQRKFMQQNISRITERDEVTNHLL